MTKKATSLLILLLVAIFGNTCYGAPPKATTPQIAIKNMQQAMLDNSPADFAACFDATDTEKEALVVILQFFVTIEDFVAKMEKAYGENSTQFARANPMGDFRSPKWVDSFTFVVDGDKATAALGEGKPIDLLKKEGVWLLDVDGMAQGPADKNLAFAKKMFTTLNAAVKEQLPKIGKEGVTAKQIDEAIGKAMMKVMMELMQEAQKQQQQEQ